MSRFLQDAYSEAVYFIPEYCEVDKSAVSGGAIVEPHEHSAPITECDKWVSRLDAIMEPQDAQRHTYAGPFDCNDSTFKIVGNRSAAPWGVSLAKKDGSSWWRHLDCEGKLLEDPVLQRELSQFIKGKVCAQQASSAAPGEASQ
jgi:hypothetical protein